MRFFNRKEKTETQEVEPQEPRGNVSWRALNTDTRILQNCGRAQCETHKELMELVVSLATRFFGSGDVLHLMPEYHRLIIVDKGILSREVVIDYPREELGSILRGNQILMLDELPMLLKKMEYWTFAEYTSVHGIPRDFMGQRDTYGMPDVHLVIPKDKVVREGEPLEPSAIREAINAGIQYLLANPDVYEYEFGNDMRQ